MSMNPRTVLIAVVGVLLGVASTSAQQSAPRGRTGWIGIRYDLIAKGAADGRRVTLVRVTDAVEGGPAAVAGIEPGDTIIRLNGTPLSVSGWTTLTQSTRAGDRLRLTVQRDGRLREVLVSAEERPAVSPSVATQMDNARRDMTLRMESVRDRVERANGMLELEVAGGDSVRRTTLRLLDNMVKFNYSVSDSGYVTVEFFHGDGEDVEAVRIEEALHGAGLPRVPADRWLVRTQERVGPEAEAEAEARLRERQWTAVGTETWLGRPGMAADLPFGVLLLQSSEADSLKEHLGRLQIRLAQVSEADQRTRRERTVRSLTRSELRDNERVLVDLAEEHRIVLQELSGLEGRIRLLSREALEQAAAVERPPTTPTPTGPPVVRRPRTVTAGLAGQNIFAGAQLADLNAGLATYFDVEAGVLVTDVYRGTPAARAGVQSGDVITRLNGTTIRNLADLRRTASRAEESELNLVLMRRGEEVMATFLH